jgi:CRISPR-associated protein Csa2
MGIYASFSFRILTNAEALNAVEPLGNIIRHRRATIIVPRNDRHEVFTVPAVSGEAIRHGYQLIMVKLAKARGINVCKLCELGEFVKHGVPVLIENLEKDLHEVLSSKDTSLPDKELKVLETCAIEDVGGFLIPMEDIQIKRTSRIEVSYMLPAIDDLKFGLDTQFHVRSAPQSQQAIGRSRDQAQPQSIYYVESASAVYTFTVNINLSEIGVVSNCLYSTTSEGSESSPDSKKAEKSGKKSGNKRIEIIDCKSKSLAPDERVRRAELAIDALAELVKNGLIGGHHSSYSPHWQPISGVALVTRPIQTVVYPGHVRNYVQKTANLAKGNKELLGNMYNYEIFTYWDKKLDPGLDVGDVKYAEDITQFFKDVKSKALEWLKEELGMK